MKTSYKILILIIGAIIVAGSVYYLIESSLNTTVSLGSNDKGYVTKVTYTHPGYSGPKIAIITGMHPREISAKMVVPEVIKAYVATHNVEIVNYVINVTADPTNFDVGRANGQDLVAEYAIPDIVKSNYSMVIICHDHEMGYGNGYYFATPTMDEKSVALGKLVHNLLPDFNYYERNTDTAPEGTSIDQVDTPITNSGTPVLVYEIPEWEGNSDVYSNTTRLIGAIFNEIW